MNIDQTFKLGINALKEKDLIEAEKIFNLLVAKDPNNSEFNHFLGITLQLLNKVNDAIIYYKKSIEINPKFSEAYKNLGNMFYRLGKIDEAEMNYKKSLEIDPKLDEAKINLEVVTDQKKVVNWMFKNKNNNNKYRKK